MSRVLKPTKSKPPPDFAKNTIAGQALKNRLLLALAEEERRVVFPKQHRFDLRRDLPFRFSFASHIGCPSLLFRAPQRAFSPSLHLPQCPPGRLVRVARRAWIRNFVTVGHGRRDKRERMSAHLHIGDGGLDLRHVTGNALAAC